MRPFAAYPVLLVHFRPSIAVLQAVQHDNGITRATKTTVSNSSICCNIPIGLIGLREIRISRFDKSHCVLLRNARMGKHKMN